MRTPRLLRAQWGAKPVPATRPTRVSSTEGSAVHWVGGSLSGGTGRLWDHSRCDDILRGIQEDHQDGEWYDIAYNEAACPHGVRYELRGHHVQTGANGTSTANRNWYAILALVGKGDPVTPDLLLALAEAAEDYRLHAAAGPRMTGHRDHKSSECPGDLLYGHVRRGTFTTVTDTSKEELMTTAREVSADLMGWDTIPCDRIPFGPLPDGSPRKVIDPRNAAGYTLLWTLETRDSALRTEAMVQAFVANGSGLTPAAIQEAVDQAFDRRVLASTVDMTIAKGEGQ